MIIIVNCIYTYINASLIGKNRCIHIRKNIFSLLETNIMAVGKKNRSSASKNLIERVGFMNWW